MDEELQLDEWSRYKREQARSYLRKVNACRKRLVALEAEAKAILEDAAGLKAVDYSAVRVSSSPSDDAMVNAIAKLEKIVEVRTSEAVVLADTIAECGVCLESLGGRESTLLRMHYVAGMSLTEIGKLDEWKHDKKYMSVLHLQALESFYDHMPHSERDPLPSAI